LKKSALGEYTYDADAEKNAILDNRVPENWKYQYTSKNLKSWLKELSDKIEFNRASMRDMLNVKSFWIGSFLNPKKFFNAVTLQMISLYEEKKTLDEIELSFEVRNVFVNDVDQPPQVG